MPEEQTNKVEEAAKIANTVHTWNNAAIVDAAQGSNVPVPQSYLTGATAVNLFLDAVEITSKVAEAPSDEVSFDAYRCSRCEDRCQFFS